MPLLGLTGYPLAHSFSPAYFKEKFHEEGLQGWDYRLFPLENLSELPALIAREPELLALNVTIPHKEKVLAYCHTLSEELRAIGAANLLLIRRGPEGPELSAYNTDHSGFSASLQRHYRNQGGKALVLGSGGSSKAVAYALGRLGIPFDIAGRSLALHYGNLDISGYSLLINCTPVGMQRSDIPAPSPLLPLDYNAIHAGQFFFDLVYNPAQTAMMQEFGRRGASVLNGLEMLHLQADQAWELIREQGMR